MIILTLELEFVLNCLKCNSTHGLDFINRFFFQRFGVWVPQLGGQLCIGFCLKQTLLPSGESQNKMIIWWPDVDILPSFSCGVSCFTFSFGRGPVFFYFFEYSILFVDSLPTSPHKEANRIFSQADNWLSLDATPLFETMLIQCLFNTVALFTPFDSGFLTNLWIQ